MVTAALAQLDHAAQRRLTGAYRAAWQQLADQLDALERAVADAETPGALYHDDRFAPVHQAIRAQIDGFTGVAAETVTWAQGQAVSLAELDTHRTLGAALLPPQERDRLIGFLSDGTPVSAYLAAYSTETLARIERRLATAVATELTPAVLTRQLRGDVGWNLTRALTTVRTEALGSYRRAALALFRQHATVLRGWRWVAALSVTTCPPCWALHGSVHPLAEPFAEHVRGKCVPAPVLMSEPTDHDGGTGEAAFAALDPKRQRQILGPLKYALYAAHHLTLRDLVRYDQSDRWGVQVTEASVDQALRAASRRRAAA